MMSYGIHPGESKFRKLNSSNKYLPYNRIYKYQHLQMNNAFIIIRLLCYTPKHILSHIHLSTNNYCITIAYTHTREDRAPLVHEVLTDLLLISHVVDLIRMVGVEDQVDGERILQGRANRVIHYATKDVIYWDIHNNLQYNAYERRIWCTTILYSGSVFIAHYAVPASV